MSSKLDPNDVRFFSGRSNPQLAQSIADALEIPLDDTEFSKFSNDNMFVQLGASVRGRKVYILQSLTTPVSDHLVELLMMIDIAQAAAAKEIHAIIPYFSYARSDKKDAPRISITARLIADLLATAGASHVMTMTLHSPQVHGFFGLPTDHLTADRVFADYLRQRDLSNAVVVAPDIGHAKRAAKLARDLEIGVAAGDKERLADDRVRINGIIGDIKGKLAIVFDDEISTAGSMMALVDILLKNRVERVILACTHGVFSGPAIERLQGIDQLDEIITTNTVPISEERRLPNMTVLSVAPIFGEAIRRNILGESVGSLFAFWPENECES